MVPAGTKFTLGNIGKSLGFSIISSGRYDVPKTVFENSFQYVGESALERILKEGVKQNAQSFSCEWMEKPIKKALAGYPSKMFALDLTTSATKGMVRKLLNAPGPVPFPNLFPANLSADYALNEYWHLSRRKMRRDHHLFLTENWKSISFPGSFLFVSCEKGRERGPQEWGCLTICTLRNIAFIFY